MSRLAPWPVGDWDPNPTQFYPWWGRIARVWRFYGHRGGQRYCVVRFQEPRNTGRYSDIDVYSWERRIGGVRNTVPLLPDRALYNMTKIKQAIKRRTPIYWCEDWYELEWIENAMDDGRIEGVVPTIAVSQLGLAQYVRQLKNAHLYVNSRLSRLSLAWITRDTHNSCRTVEAIQDPTRWLKKTERETRVEIENART